MFKSSVFIKRINEYGLAKVLLFLLHHLEKLCYCCKQKMLRKSIIDGTIY